MDIVLATKNPTKVDQIKAIFSDERLNILTQTEAGLHAEAVEDGDSLESNAIKKALFVSNFLHHSHWTMADDTGLFIFALGGAPGIHSSRWAGKDASTEEITAFTLKEMEGMTDRSAIFRTAVVLVSPDKQMFCFEGEVSGYLLEKPRLKPQPKMPYSPLFVVAGQPNGEQKTWAEMTVEEENAISHRGIAFRKVREFLGRNFI